METSDRVADRMEARVVEPRLAEQRDYWIEKLTGQICSSNLKPDFSRPEVYAFSRGSVPVALEGDLYQRLKILTSDGSFLLYTTLMAALKVCIYKYTGNLLIVIGSPARRLGGRQQDAAALAILDQVDDRLTFKQFLLRVRESLLDAYSNQDYDFEYLVDGLGLGSIDNRCPLFDIALMLTDIHCPLPQVKNDITIVFNKEPGRVSGEVIFNENLFRTATIESFVSHYLNILTSALEDTSRPISRLQLLSEAQRDRLILELTEAKGRRPRIACLHELFEESVDKDPNAIALEYGEERVSYRELNERANHLAHYLRELGVDREVLVGISLERSVEMVVGLLGILKAGGAYLPMDVSIPDGRLSFIIEDAGVSILLTMGKAAERFADTNLRLVRLDSDWPDIARHSKENPRVELSVENLAYVNYTSGTVGIPKGSEIPHRAIPGFVAWADELELDQTQVFLQYSSISWDALTLELWPALTGGARCALYSNALVTPEKLGEAINRHGITIVWITSSLLNSILDSTPEILSGVKQLLTGGEALSVSHIRRAQEILPNLHIINGYGPSECTVFCCSYPIAGPIEKLEGSVSIGRPIGDRRVYLLDRNLNLAPVGVIGELHIGGPAVARGYLRRQELTAVKFIPDPFSREPGARLYKTGDLARYLSDGRLEFIGREDDQIKLHGYRIETGEIEACLASHALVRKSAVLVREGALGDKRLVAYVVGEQDKISVPELFAFLRSRLPDFMIPSAIVVLDRLPLTENGKLDRRALPAPTRPRPSTVGELQLPRTATEERVAAVWGELLGYGPVGVFDNFFEFGGNSIRAFHLFSKIRGEFEIDLPLKHLFDTPTVAGLSAILGQSVRADRLPRIAPADRDKALPASFAQQRLWFLDQLQPESPFYNIPGFVRVEGDLNISALEKSFGEIVRRHESLRTVFQIKEGRILQVVRPAEPVTLPVWDLGDLPEGDRESEAQRIVTGEVLRPFNLANEPMLRPGLVRLGPTDHVILFIMHHIISDGWSMGIFRKEIAALYEAFCRDLPSPLPELSVQYADYAVWQQAVLEGEVMESGLSYWRENLRGAPPLLELPADHARPPVQSFRGAAQPVIIDKELASEIKQLSWREGVTLFMALLAAFKALLHRYSASEDISIGTPVAGRNHAEIEGVIGLFVNTLVLRTRLDAGPSFRDLLQRVRDTALGAFAHQDLPFEKLVEELQPERSLSYTPLFQVMFGFEDGPKEGPPLAGLAVKPIRADRGTSKFDLMLLLEDTPEGLAGSLEYNTDLFEAETIARMVRHFTSLLESAVEDPDRKLSQLTLLTEQERQQLLFDWNDNASSYPRDVCLHEIFERQAKATPNAVALVFGQERITYRQLECRANRLAHYLKKLGVGPEVLVAIMMQRDINMVVAILGVLKAGGAYVPIDPAYPPARVTFMLEDAKVAVLLTMQGLAEASSEHEAQIVFIDRDRELIEQESDQDCAASSRPDNLAYVIYTSGSTGNPKGVSIEHRSAVAMVSWAKEVFTERELRGVLASTSFCFDLSIFETFVPLSIGGKILLVDNALELLSLPAADEVTLINSVPSVVAELLRAGGIGPSVVTVNLAGEPLAHSLVHSLYEQATVEKVFNLYGPSEDTTYSTFGVMTREEGEPVTIGRPISNTSVYLLDKNLRPVPVGVPGELYIGGGGLARGYLNRADLTAERFLPDPFGNRPGARLYRTGDLASYRPDGRINFLGRIDHQIKLRGFRIELGEVEAALEQQAGVREAVAEVRDVVGEKRLVAYVVPDGEPLDSALLRNALKQNLPAYMVPSAFVILSALPLNPNGKVDRKALPEPETARSEPEGTYAAPRDETEQVIARIWRDLLGLDRVGINDNFFDLGGHSLLVIRVRERLAQEFAREVPIIEMFRHTTIASLARYLMQETTGTRDLGRVRTRVSKQLGVMSRRKAAKERVSKNG